MKDKARELKQKLERIFEAATAESERRACPKNCEVLMDDETRAAFDSVEASMQEAILQSLDPDALYALPEDGDMDDLRRALSFQPYYTYEAWYASAEISEKALLAAEKDIRAGRIAKLEAFRDQTRKQNFSMPLLESYGRYMRLLNNLSYQLWVWAHVAKRFNSFAAARHYLRAISLVNVRKTRAAPNFKPEDIDTLVEYIMDGADEIRIAADYASLKDWEAFRKEEAKNFAVATKGPEANGKKGAK